MGKEKMYRSCRALVIYKDGTGVIAEYKLENGLPFVLHEMEKWIKEQDKPVSKIEFLNIAKRG